MNQKKLAMNMLQRIFFLFIYFMSHKVSSPSISISTSLSSLDLPPPLYFSEEVGESPLLFFFLYPNTFQRFVSVKFLKKPIDFIIMFLNQRWTSFQAQNVKKSWEGGVGGGEVSIYCTMFMEPIYSNPAKFSLSL